MSKKELMSAKVEKDKVVVEIPIDLLVYVQSYRDDFSYTITDKKAMAEYVAKNILEYGEDQETGATAFHRFIDELFDEAYERAEEWIDESEDDDDED